MHKKGGAEHAGVENGAEESGADGRGGKSRSGKCRSGKCRGIATDELSRQCYWVNYVKDTKAAAE